MKKFINATHEGTLKITEDLIIPCAVLKDGTRVLISKGFMTALGRPWKGSYKSTELPNFISAKNLTPFITTELMSVLTPIKYKSLKGAIINGFKADLLPLVCDVYLRARDEEKKVLTESQEKIAKRCEILMRSFARVAIIALIDEATGFQDERNQEELQRILALYISEEFLPWTKRFPNIFYEELFRLKNLPFNPFSVKKPSFIGHLTNALVYRKLPEGVLDELKKRTPRSRAGNYTKRFHQSLSDNIGNPHLEKHLTSVITLMKISPNWRTFLRHFQRAFGQQGLFEVED